MASHASPTISAEALPTAAASQSPWPENMRAIPFTTCCMAFMPSMRSFTTPVAPAPGPTLRIRQPPGRPARFADTSSHLSIVLIHAAGPRTGADQRRGRGGSASGVRVSRPCLPGHIGIFVAFSAIADWECDAGRTFPMHRPSGSSRPRPSGPCQSQPYQRKCRPHATALHRPLPTPGKLCQTPPAAAPGKLPLAARDMSAGRP